MYHFRESIRHVIIMIDLWHVWGGMQQTPPRAAVKHPGGRHQASLNLQITPPSIVIVHVEPRSALSQPLTEWYAATFIRLGIMALNLSDPGAIVGAYEAIVANDNDYNW
jgi:hypothetical protein